MRRLSRLPLRVRLTLGFAVVAAVLLAGAGTVVFLDVKAGLDGSLDAGLRSRAAYLVHRPGERALRQALAADPPAQLLAADGRVLAGTRAPLLPPRRLATARHRPVAFEHAERTRLLARPAPGGRVLVVATSMAQRERALELLSAILLVGCPLILLLASGAGYLVAAGALRPVDRMRRRAAEISAATPGARLPLPAARDELRRLGTTLNDMLARLEAGAAGERAFLGWASHELRTPLAILKAEVELALEERGDDGALRSVGEEVDRLTALAEDLLVVARGRDGELPLRLAEVHVSALAHRLAGRHGALAGTRVEVAVDPALRVRADPARLQQALGNLLDNALRHGVPPVCLCARASAEAVELHVRDGGPGSEPERSRGFGLGLAIVDAIAAAHGGRFETASSAAGTDAWMTLPHHLS